MFLTFYHHHFQEQISMAFDWMMLIQFHYQHVAFVVVAVVATALAVAAFAAPLAVVLVGVKYLDLTFHRKSITDHRKEGEEDKERAEVNTCCLCIN